MEMKGRIAELSGQGAEGELTIELIPHVDQKWGQFLHRIIGCVVHCTRDGELNSRCPTSQKTTLPWLLKSSVEALRPTIIVDGQVN